MRRAGQGLGAVLGLALLSTPAPSRAQPQSLAGESPATPREIATPVDAVIEIERAPGAEACPDSESVFSAIKRLFPERAFHQSADSSKSVASAHVTIRPLSPGYEARVTVLRPRRGDRVILEGDEDCRGLADALALAFVLLVEPANAKLESENTAAAPTPSADSSSTAPAPSRNVPPDKDSRKNAEPPASAPGDLPSAGRVAPARTRSFRADLGASGIGGLGALSEPALGVAAGIDLFHATGWGGSLEGLRLWSRPAEAEGGSVTLTLWSLLLGPCYRGRLSGRSSLVGCVLFGAGSQHAEVTGFATPASGNFAWTVLVPRLGYRLLVAETVSGFVHIGPVVQLRPQSFSVHLNNGSGGTSQVAAAPNVGLMAELGVAIGGDVF